MTSRSGKPDYDQFDINIDLLGFFRRRLLLVVLGLFVGAIGAYAFYVYQLPVYRSEVSVLVGHRSSELPTTGTGKLEGATSLQAEILSTHIELFGSSRIIGNAITAAGLDETIEEIKGKLFVTKGGAGQAQSASVLKASYQHNDPQLAAATLLAIYHCYRDYLEEQSKGAGVAAAELLQKALTQNEHELRNADAEYLGFVTALPALISTRSDGGSELQDVHRLRLDKIEAELSEVRRTLAEAQAREQVLRQFAVGKKWEEVTEVDVLSLLTESELDRLYSFERISEENFESNEQIQYRAVSTESARAEYQRLLELIGRERILKAELGENHPSIKSIRVEIESFQKYIQHSREEQAESNASKIPAPSELLENYYRVLTKEIDSLKRRGRLLLSSSTHEAQLAKQVQANYLKSVSLKSKLERAQERYDEVFKRLQEISLSSDYAGFQSDLIAQPVAAEAPIWPAKIKIGALGGVVGLMLGLGFALLAEVRDKTFRDHHEVEDVVGSAILVHIPKIMSMNRFSRSDETTSKRDRSLAAFHAQGAVETEIFRILRTRIFRSIQQEKSQVFVVTSPASGDGKSTMIANLAVSIAQAGKHVLLIDADLRRPTIGQCFGFEEQPGLANFLLTNSEFRDCIHPTAQENLSVCPAGEFAANPSELLASENFEHCVKEGREKYDVVLIDTPPLLAFSDTSIISNVADSCLLMIHIERNTRDMVQHACDLLREQALPLLGVVVNSPRMGRATLLYGGYSAAQRTEFAYLDGYRRYDATSKTVKSELGSSKKWVRKRLLEATKSFRGSEHV
jgi:polysaccharide biosynthesis transport protein